MPTTLRQMTCDISLLLIPLLILSNIIQTLGISGVNLETCTPAESNFYIDLVDMGMTPADDRVKEAFTKAAERWQAVIVGDLEGYAKGKVSDWFNGYFKKGKYNEAVDDLVIGYEIVPLDGKGGVLGQAGASIVRTKGADKGTTISGVMQFDADDFATMSSNDMLVTILHEMGHVLGLVGTNGCADGCKPNNPSQFVAYQCSKATDEYALLNPGKTLFVENDGGAGTACVHWEEESFKESESSELMTGTFEKNLYQPLSLVTVAALDDIGGYTVDYCGADYWPMDENTFQRFPVSKTDNDITGTINSLPTAEDIETFIRNTTATVLEWIQANVLYASIIGGVLALLLLICICRCCCCRRRRQSKYY